MKTEDTPEEIVDDTPCDQNGSTVLEPYTSPDPLVERLCKSLDAAQFNRSANCLVRIQDMPTLIELASGPTGDAALEKRYRKLLLQIADIALAEVALSEQRSA